MGKGKKNKDKENKGAEGGGKEDGNEKPRQSEQQEKSESQQQEKQQQKQQGPKQQQQRGPKQQGPKQQQQGAHQQQGPPQQQGGQQQQRGPPQQQQGPPQQQGGQQQRGPPQQQRGPPQQQGGQQQQRGPPQQQGGQQQQRGPPQQQQGAPQQQGPPQQQRAPPQQQGGQQQQRGPPQQHGGQQQQRGPPQQQGGQQQQRGPPQQQGGQQQQRGPPQQQGGQQQQRGPPQQQGGQQQQRGPPQQQQRGPPQQQQGAPQQQGPPQQQGGQQQQRGPPQQQGGQQQQRGPPQQQGGQQQQRGPPQQQQGAPQQQGPPQQQRGPPQQQGGYQQQRGPPQQQQGAPQQQGGYQQQRGPPQQQGGQQQQRGPPQQQQGASQQQQWGQQQRGPPQQQQGGPQQRGPYQQQRGPPQRGSQQSSGIVETNYLQLDITNMPNVAYYYDVKIDPDKPKKFMRSAFSLFCKNYPDIAIAYDGKSICYTNKKLPSNEAKHEVEVVDHNGRTMKFNVTVKETQNFEIDLNSLRNYKEERIFDKPMRALQCLEVILANPCHDRGVRAGRSFYKKPERNEFRDLEDGFELWIGLFQAAILGDEPYLNVDIAHKSFPTSQLLTDYVANVLRCNPNQTLNNYQLRDLNTYLRTLNVTYEPPSCFGAQPRAYRVNEVTPEAICKLNFTLEDGKKMTVADYYKSKGYTLKYPNLNALHVGSSVKKVYLPMELCRLQDGQATNKKCGPRQVAAMIKYAATSTNVRKEKIEALLRYFNHNQDSLMRAFGIGLKNKFIEVPTRCLAPPVLIYNGQAKVIPNNGSWRSDHAFFQTKPPSDGHKWAILYAEDDRAMTYATAAKFAGMMQRASEGMRVKLLKDPNISAVSSNRRDKQYYGNVLDSLKGIVSLVVVVLPQRGYSYADIKQKAELQCGILTQCIKSFTMSRKLDNQVVGNLLLKVNAKLNGTNHITSNDKIKKFDANKIMFVGADVTHPSPDQSYIPSVVGTAASHDPHGACYNMQYRLQRSTLEAIEDMEGIIEYHLQMYKKSQGCYPNHIIYYRDGVSDGQFPIVQKQELGGMKKAFSRLGLKTMRLTCIIVVKRHHTRFFPSGEASRDNKFNNVRPGTLVDKKIVHPNEVQFFMVSHQSIQGTAKPTRYNVIYDDTNMPIEEVEEMSHALCHMFPRCNRAVSYPAPAYLAHLVAFRGRVYLEGTTRFNKDLKQEYNNRLVRKEIMDQNPMYFV